MAGKSVAMVETVAVVGIPVVVVSIGISFRSSGSSGLGISRPLAIVVAVETAIGESVEETSMDGGHNRGSNHKRVAIGTIVSISVSSRLSISRPFAIVVTIETAIGESMEGGHNRGMSHKRVAIAIGTIVGIGSGLGISGPLAKVVSEVVSVVAGVGEPKSMAVDKRVAVVAVVGVSLGIGLSCHGSKEAKSSNGHGFHHFGQFAS